LKIKETQPLAPEWNGCRGWAMRRATKVPAGNGYVRLDGQPRRRCLGLIAHKAVPVRGQLAADPRNPAGTHLEPLGDAGRAVAQGQGLGDATATAFETPKPVGEVAAEGDDVGHRCRASIDHDGFLPCVLFVVVVVEPLDHHAFQPLAVRAQHIADVEVPADLAVVAGLGDAVAGQNGRVGQVGLLQLDQPDERLQGVAHHFLHSLGPGLRIQVAEGDAGVTDDLRKHGPEDLVPARNGTTGTSITGDREHRTS